MWASLPIASSPEHCLPNYPVLVHRLASLLRASFRPRLAAGVISPLRFAITSRPSRCEEDLHLQAVDHARHTIEKGAWITPGALSRVFGGVKPFKKSARALRECGGEFCLSAGSTDACATGTETPGPGVAPAG